MNLEKVKTYLRSQNISQFAEAANIRRAVIHDFLNDKNISSQHLLKILEHSFFEVVPSPLLKNIDLSRGDLKFDKSKTIVFLKLLDLIIEAYAPKKIILFGSQATGRWKKDSDFDLAIIEGKRHKRGELKILARKNKIRLFFDYVTFSETALNEGSQAKNSLESKIMKEGVTLYEQS